MVGVHLTILTARNLQKPIHTIIICFKGIQILNISFQYYSVFLSGLIYYPTNHGGSLGTTTQKKKMSHQTHMRSNGISTASFKKNPPYIETERIP
jgi:hypothetical protein